MHDVAYYVIDKNITYLYTIKYDTWWIKPTYIINSFNYTARSVMKHKGKNNMLLKYGRQI